MLGLSYGIVILSAVLLGVIGSLAAGRSSAARLVDQVVEHRVALLTIALGGLTVAFVGIVFLADRWADVDTGLALFYPRGLEVSFLVVFYALHMAMAGLLVTFVGIFLSPKRARAAAIALFVAALAMILALPAALILVFETVDGARASGA